MFLFAVTDAAGNRIQVNGSSVAYIGPDKTGKGAVIAFAVAGDAGFLTLQVQETPDSIATLIAAKLRK